jgi:1-acyl-sn-glycerol-3-phosphate acyltransferase
MLGIIITAVTWSFIKKKSKRKLTKWWCQGLLKCLNIHVKACGELPNDDTSNTMFVANHISWTDIHALNSIIPLRFIAKSEISNWPVFGYLVKSSGTIFINRSRKKDAIRIVETAAEILLDGDNIGFFPEGKTTDGTTIAPFKSSIVQAALNANSTIQPIAIKYPKPNGGINTSVAYAGETSLGESMANILKQKKPIVELHFLSPINTKDKSRQMVTKLAFNAISIQLNL